MSDATAETIHYWAGQVGLVLGVILTFVMNWKWAVMVYAFAAAQHAVACYYRRRSDV